MENKIMDVYMFWCAVINKCYPDILNKSELRISMEKYLQKDGLLFNRTKTDFVRKTEKQLEELYEVIE